MRWTCALLCMRKARLWALLGSSGSPGCRLSSAAARCSGARLVCLHGMICHNARYPMQHSIHKRRVHGYHALRNTARNLASSSANIAERCGASTIQPRRPTVQPTLDGLPQLLPLWPSGGGSCTACSAVCSWQRAGPCEPGAPDGASRGRCPAGRTVCAARLALRRSAPPAFQRERGAAGALPFELATIGRVQSMDWARYAAPLL